MSQPAAKDESLMGLVGRTWHLDAGIERLCIDGSSKTVAFLTTSGIVALGAVEDSESTNKRARIGADDGRMTISPRTKPTAPLVHVVAREGVFTNVQPAPSGGFVAATAEGLLFLISGDGQLEKLGREGFPDVAALATHKTSKRIAVLYGHNLALIDEDGNPLAEKKLDEPLSDLAFSPDGKRLATASANGVIIWSISRSLEKQSVLEPAGEYLKLSWSPRGRFISATLSGGGLQTWRLKDNRSVPMTGYPASSRSLDWGPDDSFLVTSGAYRIICWPLAEDSLSDQASYRPLETGMKGVVLVTEVAAQQERDLVAAGYGNGIVLICKAGKPDELVLRGADGDPIQALAWTNNGLSLAFGTEGGSAAIANFPQAMFK